MGKHNTTYYEIRTTSDKICLPGGNTLKEVIEVISKMYEMNLLNNGCHTLLSKHIVLLYLSIGSASNYDKVQFGNTSNIVHIRL